MFCTECGKKLQPENKFCGNCGHEVAKRVALEPVASPAESEPAPEPEPQMPGEPAHWLESELSTPLPEPEPEPAPTPPSAPKLVPDPVPLPEAAQIEPIAVKDLDVRDSRTRKSSVWLALLGGVVITLYLMMFGSKGPMVTGDYISSLFIWTVILWAVIRLFKKAMQYRKGKKKRPTIIG